MSRRWWAALLGVFVAAAGACGQSDKDHDHPVGSGSGGTEGGDGGTSQGEAGEHADAGSGATSSGGATTLTSTGSSSTATTRGTSSSGGGNTTAATTGDTTAGTTRDTTAETTGDTTAGTTGNMSPVGWTCLPAAYDDGSECHCGCGIEDPDCKDSSSDSCDVCKFSGSCAGGACPSSIDEDDNSRCDIAEGWTCSPYLYGDGTCHCGCGVVDMDCSSASRDACEVCWTGCTGQGCPGPIDEENNAICTGVPTSWDCAERFFGDGEICHCGCGALDSDCGSNDIDECDRCNFEGSCSARDCPGTIDPDDNAACEHPTPPPEWTCYAGDYADGRQCDCGCGAIDLDCLDESIDGCEDCYACDSAICPNKVDPNDITSCIPPPAAWECPAYAYADGYQCECGCGILDPDCESLEASSCEFCPIAEGACGDDYYCADVLPDDNTRCVDSAPPDWNCAPDTYADEACDCGCGVRDFDCPSGDPSDCDLCDAPGSCSDSACSDLDEDNNAVCL